MKPRFKHKESYKHRYAKEVLASWLDHEVKIEQPFYDNREIIFVADLACYFRGKLRIIYEVCHKNSIDANKLGRIQYYQYVNGLNFSVYEVQAETILMQIEKPKYIRKFDFTTII